MEPSGLGFGKPKDRLRVIRDRCSRIPLRSMRATIPRYFAGSSVKNFSP